MSSLSFSYLSAIVIEWSFSSFFWSKLAEFRNDYYLDFNGPFSLTLLSYCYCGPSLGIALKADPYVCLRDYFVYCCSPTTFPSLFVTWPLLSALYNRVFLWLIHAYCACFYISTSYCSSIKDWNFPYWRLQTKICFCWDSFIWLNYQSSFCWKIPKALKSEAHCLLKFSIYLSN